LEKFDVVIAGGSFAGLAVAGELHGRRVAIIDRKRVGACRTSACGAPISVIEEAGAGKSILYTCDDAVFHSRTKVKRVRLSAPWCTIDYDKFCKILLKKTDAKVIKANVAGMKNGAVETDKGMVRGKIYIDASGWNAALASSVEPEYYEKSGLCFGVETDSEYEDDGALHFIYDPEIIKGGMAWVFPAGKTARFGVISHAGKGNILPELDRLLAKYGKGQRRGELHGNFIPSVLRKPVVGGMFVVGDAAGQALPGTLEGIRKSLEYGRMCGRLSRRVLDGEMALPKALSEYEASVEKSRRYYNLLLWGQKRIARSSGVGFLKGMAYHIVFSKHFSQWFEKTYLSW